MFYMLPVSLNVRIPPYIDLSHYLTSHKYHNKALTHTNHYPLLEKSSILFSELTNIAWFLTFGTFLNLKFRAAEYNVSKIEHP